MKGANPAGLEQKVKTHQGPLDEETKGLNIGTHTELNEFIDRRQVECLNQKSSNPVSNVWAKDDTTLESDTDEQLIIIVPFNQTVKLHSIRLVAGPDMATAPKEIKTFVNRLTLGFDEADSIPETETLTLTEKDYLPNTVVPLRFVRYQNVNSVVLFISSNQGDEESTVLKQLVFYGSPVETTKVSLLRAGNCEQHTSDGAFVIQMSDLKKHEHDHDQEASKK